MNVTVPARSIRRWCERQWAISMLFAGASLMLASLLMLGHCAASSVAGAIAACASGAAVMAAHIGRRFGE